MTLKQPVPWPPMISLGWYTLSTDDLNLTAALAACAAKGFTLWIPAKPGGYTWSTQHIWKCLSHAVMCEAGAVFNVESTAGSGAAAGFGLLAQDTYSAPAIYSNSRFTWTGGEFLGTGTTGQHAIYFGGSYASGGGNDTSNGAPNVVFRDVVVRNFDTGIQWGNNAYLDVLDNVLVSSCNNGLIFPASLTNSGENLRILGGAIFNNTNGMDIQGSTFICTGTSFDYNTNFFMYAHGGGQIRLIGGHIEGRGDTDYWVKTADSNSYIVLDGTDISIAAPLVGNKTQYQILNGGNQDGGIKLTGDWNIQNLSTAYTMQTFGIGYVYSDSRQADWLLMISQSSQKWAKPLSVKESELADGGFEDTVSNTWGTADWFFPNTPKTSISLDAGTVNTPPGVSTGWAASSTRSLKVAPASGNSVTMLKPVPVAPGAQPTLAGYINATLSAGDTITVKAAYYDAWGKQATTQFSAFNTSFVWSSGTSGWAEFQMRTGPAPIGAAYCLFTFVTNTWGNNASAVYLDNLILEVLGPRGALTQVFPNLGLHFTPVATAATPGTNVKTYLIQDGEGTLIGRQFFFKVSLNYYFASVTSNDTGDFHITGIPFFADFADQAYFPCTMFGAGTTTMTVTGPQINGNLNTSSTTTLKIGSVSTTGGITFVAAPVPGTTSADTVFVTIEGSYQVQIPL